MVNVPFTDPDLILFFDRCRQLSGRQFLICLFALVQVRSHRGVDLLGMSKSSIEQDFPLPSARFVLAL